MSASGHNLEPPRFGFVVVVASLGGLPTLTALAAGLPAAFPVPVLVISHRPAGSSGNLALILRKQASLPVRDATPGLSAWGPGITVIPGGVSARLDADRRLELHPAARRDLGGDALLASAASAAAPSPVIGVITSGMLDDGSQGVRVVKRNGGRVLAQDPSTAEGTGMPSAAIATGCVDFVLAPRRLAAALIALTMAPGGASLLTVPTPHWAWLGAPSALEHGSALSR